MIKPDHSDLDYEDECDAQEIANIKAELLSRDDADYRRIKTLKDRLTALTVPAGSRRCTSCNGKLRKGNKKPRCAKCTPLYVDDLCPYCPDNGQKNRSVGRAEILINGMCKKCRSKTKVCKRCGKGFQPWKCKHGCYVVEICASCHCVRHRKGEVLV